MISVNCSSTDECPFPFGLSVFFPAFNDSRALPDLLARTFAVLRAHVVDYEVIVVNDGSSDDTAKVLEEMRVRYHPRLRVVTHSENRGYGAALRSGFANARKEFIFYTDGDGQYDPSELVSLLKAVTAETGLVNGYKMERNDPWHRVAIGWLYNRLARGLFGIRLRDIDCDFRLIRRSALADSELISTSGTICVELVRRLEMSGAEVVEVPVHHYPRLHGTSQFFRVRSLATTFVQLCALFRSLVLVPLFSRQEQSEKLTPLLAVVTSLIVTLLCFLAYLRSLWLPFISDDYLQIALGREYGASSGWAALFGDALYRCRATSLILTYWTERWFGLDPFPFNLSSVAIHALNSLLVFSMGMWRPIGWRVAGVAACFFAVSQRHQEAVMWYAALPELLVFCFGLLSFLFWVGWLQSERKSSAVYWGSFVCFMAALLSKESAVAIPPLLALAVLFEQKDRRAAMVRLIPFVVCAIGYFGLIFAGRATHLHFNDGGTFSLSAPFVSVLLQSAAGLFWFWGMAALTCLAAWGGRRWAPLVSIAALWSAITLLPYSFLTYMPIVPSRHTYWASVGLALVVAAALVELHSRSKPRYGNAVVAGLAIFLVAQQCSYLWTKKHAQFEDRAWPTEELRRLSAATGAPVYVKCFPYDRTVAELALRIGVPDAGDMPVVFDAVSDSGEEGVDLCGAPPAGRRFRVGLLAGFP